MGGYGDRYQQPGAFLFAAQSEKMRFGYKKQPDPKIPFDFDFTAPFRVKVGWPLKFNNLLVLASVL